MRGGVVAVQGSGCGFECPISNKEFPMMKGSGTRVDAGC